MFCSTEENTFELSALDHGKIVCVAMPQRYQMERRVVNTFIKMLFYGHVQRRYDLPKEELSKRNLLILWADEAQRFVTRSEEGLTDHDMAATIREAKAAIVAATQSSTSLIPPLGKENAAAFTLNLRNRLIFKAADEAGAVESADFLGKREVEKRTRGMSGGRTTYSVSKVDEHVIKPHALRTMKNHEAVIVHCERGWRKRMVSPVDPDGKVPSWFEG